MEMRGVVLDPSSLLHVSFSTIDAQSQEVVMVGFAMFPLFIDKKTRMPFVNTQGLVGEQLSKVERILHRGAYQIPICSEYPDEHERITYETFLQLEKIPSTTMLIRVDFSAIDDDGAFITMENPDPVKAKLAFV